MNQKCSVPGKIPSGWFNSMYGFESESWETDAAKTKYLGLDGYFILLFNLHLNRYPLQLLDEVKNAVPATWNPSSLARYLLLLILCYNIHVRNLILELFLVQIKLNVLHKVKSNKR